MTKQKTKDSLRNDKNCDTNHDTDSLRNDKNCDTNRDTDSLRNDKRGLFQVEHPLLSFRKESMQSRLKFL